jgi:hypothetical protein
MDTNQQPNVTEAEVVSQVEETLSGEKVVLTNTKGNVERFKAMRNQINLINKEMHGLIDIILEIKEIDFKNKKVSVSEDFTTITIE